MKKKHLLISTILLIVFMTACESDSGDDSFSDGQEMLDEDMPSGVDSEEIPKFDIGTSDFDFESNTKLINVGSDQFSVVDVGEGPVVLLLHGWPDSKEMWRFQIPFLVNEGYRVVATDLRGYGDAPKTEDVAAYGLASLMGDVTTILDNMEIEKVNLVTHDWGAALGWTMARYLQDRVNSFVTISIGAPGNPGFDIMEQRRQNWYLFMFAQEKMGAYELAKDDWALFREMVFHPDEDNIIANLTASDGLSTMMKIYQANYESLLAGCSGGTYTPGSQFDIEYPLVSAPTLGILGKYDFAMLQPQMINSKDYVVDGNFEYKYLEDVGHWLMLEKPDLVNNMIKDFLDCNVMMDCN